MGNTQDIGDLSQLMLMAAMAKEGFKLLDTVGENHRFDFAFYGDGVPIHRVQAKTARMVNGALRIPSKSSISRAGGKYEQRRYTKDEIDFIGAYSPDTDESYLIPIDEVKSEISLRVKAPKGKNASRPMWAKDYKIENGRVCRMVRQRVANAPG